jgi:hypothetical protein
MKPYASYSSIVAAFVCAAMLALAVQSQAHAATVTTTLTGVQNWSDPTVWCSARTGTIIVNMGNTLVSDSTTTFITDGIANGDTLVEPNGIVLGIVNGAPISETMLNLQGTGGLVTYTGAYGIQRAPQAGDDVVIGNSLSAATALVLTLDVAGSVNSITVGSFAPASVTFDLGGSPNLMNVATTVTVTAPSIAVTYTLEGDANTSGLNITGDLDINANGSFPTATAELNVNNGSFTIGGNLNVNSGPSSTNMSVNAGSITLTGQANINGSYSTGGPYTFAFVGNGAQTIPALPYAFLSIQGNRGSNSVTFAPGTAAVFNNLDFSATFTTGGYITTGNEIRFTGNAPQFITDTGNVLPVFNDFRNDNLPGGSVTLQTDILVQGQLMFNSGQFITGTHTLTVGSAGSATGANAASYVVGNLSKMFATGPGQAFTFDVGDATHYTPVALTNGNATAGPGDITVATTAGNHPQIATSGLAPTKTAARYWTLSSAGLMGTFDAAFNFGASDVTAGTPANFVLKEFNGSAWLALTAGAALATSTQATGLNFATLGDFQAGELAPFAPPPILPPIISGITSTAAIAMTGTPVTFTAAATDPQGLQLTFSWDFGEGTPARSGNPVTYSFVTGGNLTVTLTVSNGTAAATQTQMITTLAPSSGGLNVPNIAQGAPEVIDPITMLGISVSSSNGGVIQLNVDVDQLRGLYNISTDFNPISGRSTTVTGPAPLNKFTAEGIFVAHATAVDPVSGAMKGKGRKTLLISSAELGDPPAYTMLPINRAASKVTVRGKFSFPKTGSTSTVTDSLTFGGNIELPLGFDVTSPQTFFVGLANIIDSVNLNAQGKAQLPSAGKLIQKFSIKYPHLKNGAKKTIDRQTATAMFTLNGSNFSSGGADTDGITNTLLAKETVKKPLNRSIQVGLEIAGVPYQFLMPVQLKLSADSSSGVLGGRSSN